MLRDVAVARIQRGLGFRSDQTDNIIYQLQEEQRLLERGRTLPYFLLQEDATLTLVAASATVELPTGFLREKFEERPHFVVNESLRFLEKMDFDQALAAFEGTDTGSPQAYVLRKDSLLVYPTPDIGYSVTWSYFKAAESLATNIENAWLEEEYGAPEVLIGKTGVSMARLLKNKEAEREFQQLYTEAWTGMLADSIERDAESRLLEMGGRL